MVVFAIFASALLQVNNVYAQQNHGSSQTTEQTDECLSGLRYKCEGSGTLCEITTWICQTNPRPGFVK